MAITIIRKTPLKRSLKLLNHIYTFLFEEEYEELEYFTPAQIKKLEEAARVLDKVTCSKDKSK